MVQHTGKRNQKGELALAKHQSKQTSIVQWRTPILMLQMRLKQ